MRQRLDTSFYYATGEKVMCETVIIMSESLSELTEVMNPQTEIAVS